MTARRQTVSFTSAAFAYAQTLVDAGEYPSISAAVSGEMVRAKAARAAQAKVLAAEVERLLALPLDQWEPVGELFEVTTDARARLAELRRTRADRPGAILPPPSGGSTRSTICCGRSPPTPCLASRSTGLWQAGSSGMEAGGG
jgi:antitoxin ParD1/3/4